MFKISIKYNKNQNILFAYLINNKIIQQFINQNNLC